MSMFRPDVVGLLLVAALSGCVAAPPPTPPAQPAPLEVRTGVTWPDVRVAGRTRYEPATGSESTMTINDVTLRFRVVNVQDGSDLEIPCALPDGRTVMLPVYALGLWLDVENRTDHILRFGGSELVVEDEQAKEIPLFRGSWDAWKASVAARIEAFYAVHMDAWSRWQAGAQRTFDEYAQREVIPYAQEYHAYVRDVNQYLARESKPDFVNAYEFDRARSEKEATPTPEALLERSRQQLSEQVATPKRTLDEGRRRALEAVERLQRPNLLTPDEWAGLRVLPGRSLAGIVPLNAALDGDKEAPRDVHVQVIDLVTKTDAAANATERSQFAFQLTRVAP